MIRLSGIELCLQRNACSKPSCVPLFRTTNRRSGPYCSFLDHVVLEAERFVAVVRGHDWRGRHPLPEQGIAAIHKAAHGAPLTTATIITKPVIIVGLRFSPVFASEHTRPAACRKLAHSSPQGVARHECQANLAAVSEARSSWPKQQIHQRRIVLFAAWRHAVKRA
jgi:hypothetical protein